MSNGINELREDQDLNQWPVEEIFFFYTSLMQSADQRGCSSFEGRIAVAFGSHAVTIFRAAFILDGLEELRAQLLKTIPILAAADRRMS